MRKYISTSLSKAIITVFGSVLFFALAFSPAYAADDDTSCIDGGDLGSIVGTTVATGTTIESDTDVAYTWTAPADGIYTFTTEKSAYDTLLAIHDGIACPTPAVTLANNDDNGSGGLWSALEIYLTAEQTITIVIDGYAESDGSYILNILADPTLDVDQDGFTQNSGDCEEGDATIYPGAPEIPYDTIDQDCDGGDLVDVDEDQYSPSFNNDILAWTPYADAGLEYANTLNALSTYYHTYTVTESTTTDATILANELQGKEVFLIPYQRHASNDDLQFFGESVSTVLTNFVHNGGTVISLAEDYYHQGFTSATGLMNISYKMYAYNDLTITDPTHAITLGFPATISTVLSASVYTIENSDADSLVTYNNEGTVVATRSIGNGHVVVMGFDFFSYNPEIAQILSNAVQWSQSNPIDCNDNDSTVYENQTYYEDLDSDGLGNADAPVLACSFTAPEGYVSNNTDENDVPVTPTPTPTPTETPTPTTEPTPTEEPTPTPTPTTEPTPGTEPTPTPEPTVEPTTTPTTEPTPTEEPKEQQKEEEEEYTTVKVAGATNGNITVTYSDERVVLYPIFTKQTERKTKVKRVNKKLAVVVSANGKAVALVNTLTGEILSSQKLSAKAAYAIHDLKIQKVRKKRTILLTSSNKKKQQGRVAFLTLSIKKQQLKKPRILSFDSALKVKKIKVKKAHLTVRNTAGDTIATYLITKKFQAQMVQ